MTSDLRWIICNSITGISFRLCPAKIKRWRYGPGNKETRKLSVFTALNLIFPSIIAATPNAYSPPPNSQHLCQINLQCAVPENLHIYGLPYQSSLEIPRKGGGGISKATFYVKSVEKSMKQSCNPCHINLCDMTYRFCEILKMRFELNKAQLVQPQVKKHTRSLVLEI